MHMYMRHLHCVQSNLTSIIYQGKKFSKIKGIRRHILYIYNGTRSKASVYLRISHQIQVLNEIKILEKTQCNAKAR